MRGANTTGPSQAKSGKIRAWRSMIRACSSGGNCSSFPVSSSCVRITSTGSALRVHTKVKAMLSSTSPIRGAANRGRAATARKVATGAA